MSVMRGKKLTLIFQASNSGIAARITLKVILIKIIP